MSSNIEYHRRRRLGSVLIAVLAILFTLSLVVTRFIEETVRELTLRGQFENRPDLRAAAYTGMETAFAVIHELLVLDGTLHAPVQGWADPLAYADFDVGNGLSVSSQVTDLTGKVPLASLDETQLPLLFESLGFDSYDSLELADSLLDWTDGDDLVRLNGAEADAYGYEEPVIQPPNAPLASLHELRWVAGFRDAFFDAEGQPNAAFSALIATVTLYPVDAINLNTARPGAYRFIQALEGGATLDPLLRFLAGDDGEAGTADDQFLRSEDNLVYTPAASANLVGYQAQVLEIRIDAKRGPARLTLTAVIQLPEGANRSRDNGQTSGLAGAFSGTASNPYPFTILALAENSAI
ncbi:MAG: general secretion pathway protein GspK [Opitutales bacterium]